MGMVKLIPDDGGMEELLGTPTRERKKKPCPDDEDDHEFEESLDAVVEELAAEAAKLTEIYKGGKKVEIHSDKWHRCINKVKKRGGGYNAYAVCTASIGKAGSLKRGHGGSA